MVLPVKPPRLNKGGGLAGNLLYGVSLRSRKRKMENKTASREQSGQSSLKENLLMKMIEGQMEKRNVCTYVKIWLGGA